LYEQAQQEINERKLAEEALIYERNLLNALMDNIPDHIYFKDIDSRFIRMNRAQANGFGISNPVQAMGKTDFDFFTEQHARPAFENEQEIIKTGLPMVNFEETETYRDGRLATVSTTKIPFRNPDGQIIGTIGISRDITERKQAEEEIRQLNVNLEKRVDERTRELHQAQEELVHKEKLAVLGQLAGSVGHELRNPLGVINNSVYYLKMIQPEANEKIKKYHAMIEQEVHNAAKIVGDLLDYARVILTDPKPGSVPGMVEHTLSRFPVPVSIPVSLEIPADLPHVYADPLHVEQILGNLITNACQAMDNGGNLTISARVVGPDSATYPESSTGRERKKHMVAIGVKDTGTGITPENMKKLFEPLFTTKARGIGLGLAVSKKLAEANGGRIEVESQVGKGSTFTLYLPVNEGS
jgi:PAS domain S-box-containing protein